MNLEFDEDFSGVLSRETVNWKDLLLLYESWIVCKRVIAERS